MQPEYYDVIVTENPGADERVRRQATSALVLLRLHDFRQVDFDPVRQCLDVFADTFAERSQRVIHVRRNDRVDRAFDESVAFQSPQGLRKHLFANAADFAAQVAESQGSFAQRNQHEHTPAAGHVFQNGA